MLSQLYRIARDFERSHGVAPNLLYLNYQHFEQLRSALPGLRDNAELLHKLGLQLILQRDRVHPGVAWSSVRARTG
ncbi:MAG: hypothetical protein ACE5FQ_12970 [Thiogranum sp.]